MQKQYNATFNTPRTVIIRKKDFKDAAEFTFIFENLTRLSGGYVVPDEIEIDVDSLTFDLKEAVDGE